MKIEDREWLDKFQADVARELDGYPTNQSLEEQIEFILAIDQHNMLMAQRPSVWIVLDSESERDSGSDNCAKRPTRKNFECTVVGVFFNLTKRFRRLGWSLVTNNARNTPNKQRCLHT